MCCCEWDTYNVHLAHEFDPSILEAKYIFKKIFLKRLFKGLHCPLLIQREKDKRRKLVLKTSKGTGPERLSGHLEVLGARLVGDKKAPSRGLVTENRQEPRWQPQSPGGTRKAFEQGRPHVCTERAKGERTGRSRQGTRDKAGGEWGKRRRGLGR